MKEFFLINQLKVIGGAAALLAAFFVALPAAHAETYFAGTISSDTTWTAVAGPYVVSGLTVVEGATLTIEPGTVVKFNNKVGVTFNGNLIANGTATAPIYFTSLKDDGVGGDTNADGALSLPVAGDWDGLHVGLRGSPSVAISHAVIRYAGAVCPGCNAAALYVAGGTVTVDAVQIFDAQSIGLGQDNGTVTVTGSEIARADVGYLFNFGTGNVSGSSLHDNTTWGMNAPLSFSINAANNWWGAASGPQDTVDNPTGTGNAVGGQVVYAPFLTTDPFAPVVEPPPTDDDHDCNHRHGHAWNNNRGHYYGRERRERERHEERGFGRGGNNFKNKR